MKNRGIPRKFRPSDQPLLVLSCPEITGRVRKLHGSGRSGSCLEGPLMRWIVSLLLCLAAAALVAEEAEPAASPQVSETIIVTAARTETRLADSPASVVVLSRDVLDASPAPTIDDTLRQVAGFTLFRRTGSRVANPTAQGVTLRGIGASGASRALVLDDGVPLNDPFGGWVYWGRVPRVALERVEVLRGGASDLYGSSAMGGVVQFIRRREAALAVDASAGSQQSGAVSLFAGGERGDWSGSIATDLFTTGGYVLVRPEERGIVDVEASSRHAGFDATLRRQGAFARASHYSESRDNGTPLQENDTTSRHLSLGADLRPGGGVVALRGYGSDQDYFQTFSAVAADRASERLTVEQRVPSRGTGGSAQWTSEVRERHVLVAGAELRTVRGRSDEMRFTPVGTSFVSAGGRQRTAAVYLEDVFSVTPALSIVAGVRADQWRNEGGGESARESQLSPRLSLLWRAGEAISFSASAYRAFRAPTLNELYRGFRVGNIETLPNAALGAENLTGFEIGARARNARLTLFAMEVEDTIANVTISTSPALITRQRQNLGTTRSIGAELDTEWRLGRNVRASAGWLFVDATVREGELRGRRIPQVPRHQATAQLLWRNAGAQARWSAMQYDDDRNELLLASYIVVDLFAAQPLRAGIDMTLAVENVFAEKVEASATPVITHGQPRAAHLGLRYRR
jgi:outer membrane receptor protein involved in Fe transport